MKKILGLDLGTNSIGWALVDRKDQKILGMGSRIIPMSQDKLGEFDKGNSVSQTASRTGFRNIRRLRERHLLRRERIHRVLNVLQFLPDHYASQVDFKKRLGQFQEEREPKLAYDGKRFIFESSFLEMLEDFKTHQPELLNRLNKKGEPAKIPYDWTIYYLRKKALTQKIEKEELAWILLNFNKKRGYYQLRGEDDEYPSSVKEYVELLKVVRVEKGEQDKKNDKKHWYNITLENGWIYSATFSSEPKWLNTEKEFLVTEEYDEYGSIKIIKDRKQDKDGKEKRRITPLPSFEEIDLMSKNDQDKFYKKIKARTEITIGNSGKTVGTYIYDTLLQKPNQKIRGKLVRTIERKFYKDELKAILKKQIELQPALFRGDLYNDCVRELYRHNEEHQLQLSNRDFIHLFVDDIIFYQRPPKWKKSSIGKCTLEFRQYKSTDKEGQKITVKEYLKAIPKSHPLYQEFRVWQWLYNLKIYKKDDDTDITSEFIKNMNDLENLFAFLMERKEVNHRDILQYFISPIMKEKFPGAKASALNKEITNEIAKYRWNYVFDDSKEKEDEKSKKYPCNETGYEIKRRLEKVANRPENFFSPEIEQHLWHIIYSVLNKNEFKKALKSFAHKHSLDESSFVENFIKFKPFERDYGTYSEKAIKKLLPLMRLGKYWNWDAIEAKTKDRIEKILTGEYDEKIKDRVREKTIHLTEQHHFQGLQLWLAQYVVYDRHSEAALTGKWKSVADLEKYLEEFKQHSLRNPIVEQVLTETLRVVRDIWVKYGNGAENYFDEIHIELSREMKNKADVRKRITNQISDNENTNLRIKALIAELKNDPKIENVRPYSPIQQEALKIFEEGVLNFVKNKDYKENEKKQKEEDEAILKIGTTAQPSKSELQRYILWLEQKYRSPYTGEFVPLSKLFTTAYEIEHIIPQSRYFDDSLSNKVICEFVVNGNPYKDKQLGLEFIKNQGGRIVDELSSNGKVVRIFTEDEYKDFVKQHYDKNRGKRTKLLLEEIPDQMIKRQLNDTRYISKFISNLLSNVVRADNDDDGINSKNIISGNGKITSTLKQDWGLNDVWNDLILPRFERMNALTNSTAFTSKNKEGHTIPAIPLELSKGFQKKRIDHRHHALDALVIACATKDHVNLLNNQSAKSDTKRYDLQHKLRNTEKWVDKDGKERNKFIEFKKPWKKFTVDARYEMEKIVVSFKQNLRVINKTTNKYQSYKDENGKLRIGKNGKPKKDFVPQIKGDSWAIRKSMHTPMPYGKKNYHFDILDIAKSVGKREYIIDVDIKAKVENVLNECRGRIAEAHKKLKDNPIKDEKGNLIRFAAFKIPSEKFRKRQSITELSNRGQGGIKTSEDAVKFINKVADFQLRKDLLIHLKESDHDLEKAFSAEGLENFNSKRKTPVYKLPIAESGSGRFAVGNRIGTRHKWVEADKGTNLYFAIYEDENENRSYNTVPLNIVIERQKQGLSSVPETNEKGAKLLFHLSPNDLVYVPTDDEKENVSGIDWGNLSKEQVKRLFVVNDFSGTCYFTPNHLAKNIALKEVDLSFDSKKNKLSGSFDTKTASFEGKQIKDTCIKLQVDRLGNLSKA